MVRKDCFACLRLSPARVYEEPDKLSKNYPRGHPCPRSAGAPSASIGNKVFNIAHSDFLKPDRQSARMPEYRVCVVGDDGHLIGFEPMICRDDEEAVAKAQRLAGHDVELWSGGRSSFAWSARPNAKNKLCREPNIKNRVGGLSSNLSWAVYR
jgi:hypothetical protein